MNCFTIISKNITFIKISYNDSTKRYIKSVERVISSSSIELNESDFSCVSLY